jgi:hypothetical protein
MIRSLVELGPGSAWKLTASKSALQKRLEFTTSFAEYHSNYKGNDTETYFDVIYKPRGWIQGLSLCDRVEYSDGRVNPGGGYFLYNCVMLAYAF